MAKTDKYKELKYKGKIYTEDYQIEEILVENGFSWVIDAETYMLRLEILNDTLIINAGTWYNGIFKYGCIRNCAWKFGTFESGIIFNINWQDGMFLSGIIYNGTFYQGQFLNAKLREKNQNGTKTRRDFINCDLSPSIVKI